MKEIIVYADWLNLGGPKRMGVLRSEMSRGEEVFSFEYHDNWLKGRHAQQLDPDLKLYAGPQYLPVDKSNFGLFTDSSPDRWGRTLMQRREAIQAKKEDRKRKRLVESDYLLGIQDETRMGALRFKMDQDGNFLNDSTDLTTPPFASIRELEQASIKIESDDFFDDNEASKWLRLLLAPGSSLGGARPKANVIHPDGSLWIAKFPSRHDGHDIGAWEYLVNELGKECGLSFATAMANKYSHNQHTFLTKRFDRKNNTDRIHFASAMTLLGYKDGDGFKEGKNYLEIVDLIERYGANPTNDLKELWKRIAFSVGVSNTDDHLRNHGFLLTKKGWTLSPAFDVNPNPEGAGLSLNIDEDDNSLNFELIRSVHEYFRLDLQEVDQYLKLLNTVISTWDNKARNMGISRAEIELIEPAFRLN
jgi:serine/threonine-protein kinase HipA